MAVGRGFRIPGATAQNIAPSANAFPELKIQTWLDNRQPEPAPTTYIEFFPFDESRVQNLARTPEGNHGQIGVPNCA